MSVLVANDLVKQYGNKQNKVNAINNINFTIEENGFTSIIGASGSGKSTLLNMIGGLEKPTSGHVFIRDQDIYSLSSEKLAIFRRKNIGFIFQSYNLVSVLNVFENIILPIQLDGGKIDEEFIDEIITTLGLKEKIYNLPSQLSGGQQQRTAIARALATKPAIILADEPTGNLDSHNSFEVIKLMKQTSRIFKQTLIIVTHNEEIAKSANQIIHLEDGLIVEGEYYAH